MSIVKSIAAFIVAGLCEIGGGYLVWLWIREGKSAWLALPGGLLLIIYGIIPTIQPASFGRVYAAYGGIFVVMSLLWGWYVEHIRPDRYDILGATIVIIGITILMYAPRP